jgi:transposase
MSERDRRIELSYREIQKLEILNEVRAGGRTQLSAGRALGMTDRWVRKLLKRLSRGGAAALAHGNRGRPSPNRMAEERREQILQLYRTKYPDFNLTHFAEMLQEREGVTPPSREFLRRVLAKAGLWAARRKAPKHRQRRLRREYEGELLQVDASLHAWLGEDQKPIAIVGAVDDATGEVVDAQFFPAETTEAYFSLLKGILRKRGVPRALYSDRHSIFVVNKGNDLELQKALGHSAETQVSRALKELGIQWIPAYSPQAKGRIEKLWRTFQDRLLRELRLENIRTIDEANRYLQQRFLPRSNRKFAVPAAKEGCVYRPAPLNRNLQGMLCWKETRILARDHTFSCEGKLWQVRKCPSIPSLTGRRVEVRRTLRGSWQAWLGDVRLKIKAGSPFKPVQELRAAEPSYSKRGKVHRLTLSTRLNRT